jgi:hypothetical protein
MEYKEYITGAIINLGYQDEMKKIAANVAGLAKGLGTLGLVGGAGYLGVKGLGGVQAAGARIRGGYDNFMKGLLDRSASPKLESTNASAKLPITGGSLRGKALSAITRNNSVPEFKSTSELIQSAKDSAPSAANIDAAGYDELKAIMDDARTNPTKYDMGHLKRLIDSNLTPSEQAAIYGGKGLGALS